MVVCLNMMDEAARKGMTIATQALETALGVPVVEAIGGRGRGIGETFRMAQEVAAAHRSPRAFVYAPEAEGVAEELAQEIVAREQGQLVGVAAVAGPTHEESGVSSQESVLLPVPNAAQHALDFAKLTPAGSRAQVKGGVEPPQSIKGHGPCACTGCSSGCHADAAGMEGSRGVPRASLAQNSPVQSLVANHPSPTAQFPPARFRALQLLQSNPSQKSELGSRLSEVGSQLSEVGRPESEVRRPRADLRLPTSDLGLRTSDPGLSCVDWARAEIAVRTGQPADAAISSARHAACLTLFERVAHVARPKADWREQIDRAAMHPVWGYAVLAAVFLGFFRLIFDVGKLGEARILNVFDALVAVLTRHMDAQSALYAAVKGAVLGTAGAVAIVLPYLLPFLVGLAILEDIGYLSRVGYLMDAAMHRLGLHGTATLPILVGYGCSVPAVMATRILTTRRDRFIAAFLAVLVPCSARMTVIFALVGFYLGANYALGIYALNLIVVAVAGHLLALIWPEISPGMLMEVPAYRVPAPRVVALKTWWRLREFVLVAFPLLVIGSVLLSLVDYYGWQHGINAALSPLTTLLGLPRATGLTLIFGVLRKELSLLMLMQALGTTHVLGVMTAAQILIFTLFVTFYLPCMATLASMMRELGWRLTLAASTALLVLAIVVSLAARGVVRLL